MKTNSSKVKILSRRLQRCGYTQAAKEDGLLLRFIKVKNSMNTNIKGKITELEILTLVTKLGYSVSIPFGDKDKYDQIWDINGRLLKIQIKTAR